MEKSALIQIIRKHFDSIIAKRINEIISSYSASKDLLVFVEGPRWATLGFEKVSKGWRDFIDSEIVVEQCDWVENLQSKTIGEMGFVAGIVELRVRIKNETKAIKFRGTFILEKESDDRWKIVHEHFSQPAEDPYGIGDWLKK